MNLEPLLREIEDASDPRELDRARRLVAEVMRLHYTALERTTRALDAPALARLAEQAEVSSVLILHGLHPTSAGERVRRALDAIAGELRGLGVRADLAELRVGEPMHIRLHAAHHGTAGVAERLVRDAVEAAAPDAPIPRIVLAGQSLLAAEHLTARARRPAQTAEPNHEACDLCAAALAVRHDHALEPRTGAFRCVCAACAVVACDAASGLRLLSRRVEKLALRVDDVTWARLGLPIELAFLYRRSKEPDRVVVAYPSPAGAVQSALPVDDDSPLVRRAVSLSCDVEALLVRRDADGIGVHRVPIDRCYELVGVLRRHWRGFDGGPEAWTAVDAFFATLEDPSCEGRDA